MTASGLVIGVKMKIMLGVGIPMAMAGPYVSVTLSSGIAKGTQIAINPNCKFASLDVKAAAGVGTVAGRPRSPPDLNFKEGDPARCGGEIPAAAEGPVERST